MALRPRQGLFLWRGQEGCWEGSFSLVPGVTHVRACARGGEYVIPARLPTPTPFRVVQPSVAGRISGLHGGRSSSCFGPAPHAPWPSATPSLRHSPPPTPGPAGGPSPVLRRFHSFSPALKRAPRRGTSGQVGGERVTRTRGSVASPGRVRCQRPPRVRLRRTESSESPPPPLPLKTEEQKRTRRPESPPRPSLLDHPRLTGTRNQ